MAAASIDTDVLIVGYGPTGATLAGRLGQHGVRATVIDQASDVVQQPRAAHFDDEVMRIFQGLGAAEGLERVTRVSPGYEFRNGKGETLMFIDMDGVVTPAGWAWGYMIHQPEVERKLRQAVQAQPTVETRLGVRFDGLVQDAEGVTAQATGPDGSLTIRAKYLVGCDGASSPVREACNMEYIDLGFDEPWLVVDVLVPEGVEMPRHNMQICDPERPTTCVLMGPGRHRWEFMMKAGETADQVVQDEFIAEMLEPWGYAGRVQIERKAVYRFHALLAKRWRERRVLIAGDAAHQMPPFAGQGMCSGIRDAANLGWKLAAVCTGQAGDHLLDTYQEEREPHVRAVVETAIKMGRMVCELNPEAAAGRDAQMLAARAAGEPPVSIRYPDLSGGCFTHTPLAGSLMPQPVIDGRRLDDVLGQGWVLVIRPNAQFSEITPAGLTIVSPSAAGLGPFGPALLDWLETTGAPAVLVRPDRYIFGVGDADELIEARRDSLKAVAAKVETSSAPATNVPVAAAFGSRSQEGFDVEA